MKQTRRSHITINIDELEPVPTSHKAGTKRIITGAVPGRVTIKQVAVATLEAGETIEEHVHRDLDEYYLVLSGSGTMQVDDNIYELKRGDFVLVPAGSTHRVYDVKKALKLYYQSFELSSGDLPSGDSL